MDMPTEGHLQRMFAAKAADKAGLDLDGGWGAPHPNWLVAARALEANMPGGKMEPHSSIVLPWDDFVEHLKEGEAALRRARRLAAKLEEVVAMRTAIVRAVAERDPDARPDQMIAVQTWARAQLSEVP